MATPPTILIADMHEVTRANVASVLKSLGFNVLQAIDGATAIKVVQEHPVDMALFEPDMSPVSGFEFARYVLAEGLKIPLVLMATERTADTLHYATEMGVQNFLAKPVDPHRLESLVRRILKLRELPSQHLSYTLEQEPRTPDDIMAHVIELARRNAAGGFGQPFAAAVVSPQGHIIGEGANLFSSRFDPVAQSEVMAIRQATERLEQPNLEGCSIYCAAEPTAIGMALINSVGIETIHYALSHADIAALRTGPAHAPAPKPAALIRIGEAAARAMFESVQKK